MADDIELPEPDGTTLRLTDGTDRVLWRDTAPPGLSPVYTEATVRRLIAERVAAAVAAERERRAQSEAEQGADARRLDWLERTLTRDPEAIYRGRASLGDEDGWRYLAGGRWLLAATLRAAIDAAMQAEREEDDRGSA